MISRLFYKLLLLPLLAVKSIEMLDFFFWYIHAQIKRICGFNFAHLMSIYDFCYCYTALKRLNFSFKFAARTHFFVCFVLFVRLRKSSIEVVTF